MLGCNSVQTRDRFGNDRGAVAKRLEGVSGESFAAAVRKYLGMEKAAVFRITN